MKKIKYTAPPPDFIFLAGGTGGHVIPATVLADKAQESGYNVLFITDTRGARFLPKIYKDHALILNLPTGTFLKRLFGGIKNIPNLIKFLKTHNPLLVMGFGGYPSFAGGVASLIARLPLFLQEQNAILGRVNRLLLWGAEGLFLTFHSTQKVSIYAQKKTHIMGPVVRPEFEDIKSSKKDPTHKFRLLVFGGSQGASFLAKTTVQALSRLTPEERARIQLTLQSPQQSYPEIQDQLKSMGLSFFELSSFFDDIPLRMQKTDLIISRAGASSVGEIWASFKPAIFIPLPKAMDDHQRLNAQIIETIGGGWHLPQKQATPDALAKHISLLLNSPKLLRESATILKKTYVSEASHRIIGFLDGWVKERHKEA